MTREIKFRAKATEDFLTTKRGEWRYGKDLHQGDDKICIDGAYCDPNTLCQFTGVKDKNDVEIYEGDIVRWKEIVSGKECTYTKVIVWEHFETDDFGQPDCVGYYNIDSHMEIVGDVFDNPNYLIDKIHSYDKRRAD